MTTRLTLCMIVRDEAENLPACLESVQGLCDAMVIVDTGSRDDTPAIARSFGAQVIEHPWNDDFSAARNAALPFVETEFLLVLDADERLGGDAQRVIREAIAANDFDLGQLPLSHAKRLEAVPAKVLSGEERLGEPVRVPRLIRRDADFRWEGRVHESVDEWAKPRVVRDVEAPIVHYGACEAARTARDKNGRNLRLLERRAAEEPRHPSVQAYYALELQRAGRIEDALSRAEIAWGALRDARTAGDRTCDVVLPGTVFTHLLIVRGRLEEVPEVLSRARDWSGDHSNFCFLSGVLAEQHSLRERDPKPWLEEAEGFYRTCLSRANEREHGEPIPGGRGWQAWTRLGTLHLRRGQGPEARAAFETALSSEPGSTEAELGLAEALMLCGREDDALARLLPLAEGGSLDAWLLAVVGALSMGSRQDAALFANRAIACAATPLVAPHRALILEDLTTPPEAAGSESLSAGPPAG
ncbi:MAG: glycosyltransferase [Myxococcota bacterium]